MPRRFLTHLLLCLLTLHLETPGVRAETASESVKGSKPVDDVLAAWARRQTSIRSFSATVIVQEKLLAEDSGPDQAKGHLAPMQVMLGGRKVESRLEFAIEGEKLSQLKTTRVFEAKEPPAKKHQRLKLGATRRKTPVKVHHEAFNGVFNSGFFKQGQAAVGEIDRRGKANRDLVADLDVLAIHLWLNPTRLLESVKYRVDNREPPRTIGKNGAERLWRLQLVRSLPNWSGLIEVDPARGFAPTRFQTQLRGRVSMDVAIQYMNSDGRIPVIQGWEVLRYGDSGKLEATRKGTLAEHSVNQNIDDSVFTVTFPIGAHVTERIDGEKRYFAKRANGLEPIEKEMYGRFDLDGQKN